jgi:hypothetical protein
MKKLKLLLLLPCLISTVAFGQINQVKIVSFQVKNTLPAKIDDWNTVPAALILTAQKPPTVQLKEPKLIIQIKSNGTVICGNNPATAQPISPFDVKTFTTNELTGMLGNCKELKEGTYQICAQFYNLDRIAISNEVCKEFKVEGAKAAEDYASPTLITPDNGKVFTEVELKRPLNFRWTPLVPKPQQPITYRLRVWQLMQGQNGTGAMRSNQPIVEKDVANITQTTITNLYTGPCKPPYLCDFIWNVQALNKEGKPMGRNNGLSEAWSFSAKQNIVSNPNNPPPPPAMMAGAIAEFKIDSAVCLPKENGLYKYHIWAHYKNIASSSNDILINDALNFPGCLGNPNPGLQTNLRNNIRMKSGIYNGALTMNDILESSSGTISNISPLPASIFTPASLAPNSSHNFQFDYGTATNSPVQFTYYGLVDDALKFRCNRNARNEIDSLKYPKCPCSACDEVTINVGMQGNITNNGNGGLNFTALVASSPKKVKRIRAELVYFDMKPENENCLICNKNGNFFGNFINATTINSNFTSTIPYPHSAQLDALGDINISGGVPINFTVSIPPMVSCCNADVNFCIRYVITYEDCTVCNKLVCYNYKITGCTKN